MLDQPSSLARPKRRNDDQALIVGAGLAGLTAALALLRDGWRVRVCEQAQVLGEVGAGITLSPGAGRALSSLGVEAKVLAA